ncbi:hypothetical protein LJC69_04030 [Bacteroidales bacterium OttesenSCG-928-K22]|nr:hypothetical protein [Bacteroidales bacterium OttesenSCG-928-L14]MDL2240772.1 hypothetical protein [Bacteroidales bacterium OttesenSCG-928-K22]
MKTEFITPEIDNCQNFVRQVKNLIEDKKMYLKPNLSKNDIVKMMHEDNGDILKFCNSFNQQIFENYLNKLRMTHAAILFLGNNSYLYSIEVIGKESGFNTYESFCKTCELLTGMLPEMLREVVRTKRSLKGIFDNN